MRSAAPPRPEAALLDAVPADLARRARALPMALAGGVLHVRSLAGEGEDPELDADLDMMRARAGAADIVTVHDPDVVRHLLSAYALHQLPSFRDDAVRLIAALLDLAVGSDASDIHLEATPPGMRVRQRIDGDLHDVTDVAASTAASLVARVKVLAGLDVAERRLPQDGHLSHAIPGSTLDVRVATMPTHLGERVTLRLLPDGPHGVTLGTLGLPEAAEAALRRAARASDGLIVVCGPTGSGKTTTLHAVLRSLTGGTRNVMTLEDPIERTIAGASQTQVTHSRGLTFASGLRHLLRHDPDVLLVGEVRDRETASLAIEAAQTGHLVLTSVHALDAPAALVRLHELGAPAALIADTLRLVVAQRLLALPCPDCSGVTAGCAGCSGTGTRGRSAVAEVLEPDHALREALRDGSPPGAHHRTLSAAVGPRLRDLALDRAARGLARMRDALDATPETSATAAAAAEPPSRTWS